MAQLVSPGVEVTVTDESFYAGAAQGTVPLVVFATRSNKPNPSESDFTQGNIAAGTAPNNAGELRLVSSQRELIQAYGEPVFVTDAGTPSHGNELNEYGLHAAYQFLGISNRAYVMRADVPLEDLSPRSTAPTGPVANNSYWLDLSETSFGVFQGDLTDWNKIEPDFYEFNVPTGTNQTTNGSGSDGDFAIDIGSELNLGLFEKISGTWYRVGTSAWVSAKGTTNLVGGGTGNATLTYAPHTGVSPGNTIPDPHEGHIWIQTTDPNGGADYILKQYDSATDTYTEIFAPLFENDSSADAFYNNTNSLAEGVVYVDYDPAKATHILKRYDGTSWNAITFEPNVTEPTGDPVDGQLWYNNDLQVDIMVSDGSGWLGYRNHYPGTDPDGPQLSATAPTTQSDDTPLVDNDLWIDTSDLENYPKIYRWNNTSGQWVLIDNADQTTQNGIVFADARPEVNNPLTTNTVDADAPDATLYPAGMLLFNTRYSTGNVKEYKPNYTHEGTTIGDRWVTVSGNMPDGAPYMLRKAQRRVIAVALQDAIAGNEDLRSEFIFYNLIAVPGYPELVDEMITLNTDIKEIAFIIGDTPIRLNPSSQSIQDYVNNSAGVALNGEEARVGIDNPYVAQYYPWGLSTNIDGQEVMVPPSTMALRTYAFNDSQAAQWFAPAGTNRGIVTNAQNVGILTSEGEFKQVILSQGQRDVLYLNNINPISLQPNRGIVVLGQKTLNPQDTALDRVNVARLVNYIRFNAAEVMKPFLFEPNDDQTRAAAEVAMERFLGDLLGQRALNDFAVRVDETNNTPERIDRNELWVDVAIIPIKAVEFIYIPIRILNTGADLG